jgi:hypothetical protein
MTPCSEISHFLCKGAPAIWVKIADDKCALWQREQKLARQPITDDCPRLAKVSGKGATRKLPNIPLHHRQLPGAGAGGDPGRTGSGGRRGGHGVGIGGWISWANGAGSLWRTKLGIVAEMLLFDSSDDFARNLGPKWAYQLKPVIELLSLPHFGSMKPARADGWDLVSTSDGSPWPWPEEKSGFGRCQAAWAAGISIWVDSRSLGR